jgi:phosphopantetheinyl transferase (holo-ACP synthase)
MISPDVECGIDIQVWHRGMERLQNKFLSDLEKQYFQDDPHLITAAWSAKEAVYKWQGRRGVEFRDHLRIINFQELSAKLNITIKTELTKDKMPVSVQVIVEQHFACAFVVHNQVEHPVFEN